MPPVNDSDPGDENMAASKSAVLYRDLALEFLPLARAEGNYIILENGRKIFDALGGAAVGCIGWGNKRVAQAIMDQILKVPYCETIFYTTQVQERLCWSLVNSTNGHMARAFIVNSG
jgi:adenosylmethionine-8-amino-7-oxononanoate aminotransferase